MTYPSLTLCGRVLGGLGKHSPNPRGPLSEGRGDIPTPVRMCLPRDLSPSTSLSTVSVLSVSLIHDS